ncbi:hypothetical protein [Pelagibacterium lacus]|uniref:Secreted protein n=1 Tax=Pelagibacterium lacus TaxID=2282655 RepID=A0A369W0N2_9HYPH|nr:hypothetical protein [Pelagibacterium lacus]RDE07933.1 hypothetical protein DVH29_14105 [Pelagibacterium lacus]
MKLTNQMGISICVFAALAISGMNGALAQDWDEASMIEETVVAVDAGPTVLTLECNETGRAVVTSAEPEQPLALLVLPAPNGGIAMVEFDAPGGDIRIEIQGWGSCSYTLLPAPQGA